jgi:hypothetical protein
VYDRLAPQAQKSLVGRIQSGLRDDVGISPLAYELTMASHLMQKGVDVEWRDWDAGGYDFLVRNGSVEAEVECKTFSADIGRKVHRRHHFQLGGRIHEEISRTLDRDGSIFVDTLIADRLDGAMDEVAKHICAALESGQDVSEMPIVRLHKLSSDDIPFEPDSKDYGPAEITEFVEKRFERKNPSLLVMARKGRGIAILAIRSAKPDEVTGGIYKQLKRGATQFSGERPAFLCAHMLDMRPGEILELHAEQERGRPTGFNYIATRLFKDRAYIHTLLFSTPGIPRKSQTIEGNLRRRHYMESGLVFNFSNPGNPFANEQGLKFFS